VSNIIQSMWFGNNLSTMERLSISSYIANGHEYHLYVYDDVEYIPSGVILKDGNEIIDKEHIFSYKTGEGRGSFSAFSNYFRYKLLYDKGGWWTDTDMVCLKHYDFEDEHIFSSEPYLGEDYITSGLIKAPKGSDIMKHCWDICQSKDPDSVVWGEIGPRLVRSSVEKFGYEKYVKKYKTFCPIGFEKWMVVLNPNLDLEFDEEVYAIHLWNEMWRRHSMSKNNDYNPNCLYEKLKRKFL